MRMHREHMHILLVKAFNQKRERYFDFHLRLNEVRAIEGKVSLFSWIWKSHVGNGMFAVTRRDSIGELFGRVQYLFGFLWSKDYRRGLSPLDDVCLIWKRLRNLLKKTICFLSFSSVSEKNDQSFFFIDVFRKNSTIIRIFDDCVNLLFNTKDRLCIKSLFFLKVSFIHRWHSPHFTTDQLIYTSIVGHIFDEYIS